MLRIWTNNLLKSCLDKINNGNNLQHGSNTVLHFLINCKFSWTSTICSDVSTFKGTTWVVRESWGLKINYICFVFLTKKVPVLYRVLYHKRRYWKINCMRYFGVEDILFRHSCSGHISTSLFSNSAVHLTCAVACFMVVFQKVIKCWSSDGVSSDVRFSTLCLTTVSLIGSAQTTLT